MKKLLTTLLSILLVQVVFSQANDCETIYYNKSYTIDGNNLLMEADVMIQVNNRNCDYTKISIPFSKGDKLNIIEAGILDHQGNIVRKIKSSEITTLSAISDFSLYEDDFIKTFDLRHNTTPYRIFYKYKISYHRFITIANWYPFMSTDMPCHEATLKVIVPKDYTINYYQKDINCAIESSDKNTTYTWKGSYACYQNEYYSPSAMELFPNVRVEPLTFNYGLEGNFKTWKDFGNWIYALNQGLNNLPNSEKAQIDKLIKGISDPREIAKILYHYLQDRTRYINISIDIGGLKPYPAEYVAINKYGDCKALTNYMKALLEYVGIKSYYSLIYSGDKPIRPIIDFPSSQFFNHVILMVPFEQDTIWMECTNNICPFGYLGTSTRGRKAFVIEKDNSSFIETPKLTPEENLFSSKITIDLNNVDSKIEFMFRGYLFDYFNSISNLTNDKEKENYIREMIPFSGFELLSWSIEKANRNAEAIKVLIKAKPINFPKKYGNDIVITSFKLGIPAFEPPTKRKWPVKINNPISYSDTIVYQIPENLNVTNSLPDYSLDSDFGNYTFRFVKKQNELIFFKNCLIYGNEIPLEDYSKFYDFLNSMKNHEGKIALILKPFNH